MRPFSRLALAPLVLLASTRMAEAGGVLVVATEEDPVSSLDQQRVIERLRGEQRVRGHDLQSLSLTIFRDQLEAVRRARLEERARMAAREGAQLLGKLELSRAVARLQEALVAYAGALPSQTACQEAIPVLRDLAFAHWQLGAKTLAAAHAEAAAKIGRAPLDWRRYPPPFVALLAQPPPVQVTEVTLPRLPRDARIWRGCSLIPARRHLEVRGAILLRITAPRHTAWAGLLVAGREPISLPPLTIAPPLWSPPLLQEALRDSGMRALAFWRRNGPLLEVLTQWAGEAPASRWQVLLEDAPSPDRISGARARRIHGAGARRCTALAWTLSGFAAASLTTGAILAGVARQAANGIENAAEAGAYFDAELAGLDDRRRRCGTAAYVLLGVGGAAAVAALAAWLRHDTVAEKSPRRVDALLAGPGRLVYLRW